MVAIETRWADARLILLSQRTAVVAHWGLTKLTRPHCVTLALSDDRIIGAVVQTTARLQTLTITDHGPLQRHITVNDELK